MRRIGLTRWIARVLLIACPVALTQGCGRWSTTGRPVAELLQEKSPRTLRLHRPEEPPLEIRADDVRNGIVYGQGLNWEDAPLGTWRDLRVEKDSDYAAVPLRTVEKVETERPDIILPIIAGMAFTALWVGIALSSFSFYGD